MKVYVVSKHLKGTCGPVTGPIAVVMNPCEIDGRYQVEEFDLLRNPDQAAAKNAFNEVSKLTPAAKKAMGLTTADIAKLKGNAKATVKLKADDTVFVEVDRGVDGMAPPSVRNVYSEQPPADPYGSVEAIRLAPTLTDHLKREKQPTIEREIANISPATRTYLERNFRL